MILLATQASAAGTAAVALAGLATSTMAGLIAPDGAVVIGLAWIWAAITIVSAAKPRRP